MKYLSIVLFLSFIFSNQIVEPNPTGRTTIFIYHSGKTLVHENRNLEIEKSGDLDVKIVGIPSDIINTGIQIHANNFSLENFSVNKDYITEESLLKHFIGNRLILQDFENDKSFDATLISFNNLKAVYGINEGVVVNPKLKPIFPYVPEHLQNEVFIKAHGHGNIGKSIMNLSYFTNGLNWDVEYHLIINDDDKAVLKGDYQLVNNTDKSFQSTEIFLVASENRSLPKQGSRRMMKVMSAEAASIAVNTPEAVNLEDMEIYKIPHKMSLEKESHLSAPLLSKQQIVIEKKYTAKHSPTFYNRGGRQNDLGKLNPTNLYLKMKTAKKLKMHLPNGRLNIYENKDGLDMFIAEKQIPKTSKGKNIQLFLKESQDILHKFTTVDVNENSEGNFVTIEAEFKNVKNKSIKVNWIEQFSRKIEIISSSVDFNTDSAFKVSTVIELKPNEERKETITLFTPKRN